MTLQVSQVVTRLAAATVPLTPAAADTVDASSFGANGLRITVTTTGTATDVTVTDPTNTPAGNPGATVTQTCPSTGVRTWDISREYINGTTQLATINFSGARTGVTYTLQKV